jgi:hypothetical protein
LVTSRRLAKLLERQDRHRCLQTYVSIALASTDGVVEDAKINCYRQARSTVKPTRH